MQLVFVLPVFVSLLLLAIASYTDLKERIVPNKLNYSAIIFAFFYYSILSLFNSNFLYIASCAASTTVYFLFAFFLYKIGVWAGGDVKLFTAIAALNPFFVSLNLFALKPKYPLLFPLEIFIFAIFSALPVALIVALFSCYKRRKMAELKEIIIGETKNSLFAALYITAAIIILEFFNAEFLFIVAIILPVFFRKFYRHVSVLLFAAALFINAKESLLVASLSFASIFLFFSLIKIFLFSRKFLFYKKDVSLLEEGDVVAKLIIEKKGKIIIVKKPTMKTIINKIKTNSLAELAKVIAMDAGQNARVIASPRDASGLSVKQIKELQSLASKGKIPKKIELKKTMPFVPNFLIGYLFLIIFGDPLWFIL